MSEHRPPMPSGLSRRALLWRSGAVAAGIATAWTLPSAARGLVDRTPASAPLTALTVRTLAEVDRVDGYLITEPRLDSVFPHAAVSLRAPAGADLHVRSRGLDGSWSEWQRVPMMTEEGPDHSSGPAGAAPPRAPVWVGEADRSQIAVAGASRDHIDVHLVDSLGLAQSLGEQLRSLSWRARGRVAHADNHPPIRARTEWGAQPMRGRPRYAQEAEFAVLHHTVTTNRYPADHTFAIARAIQYHHQQVNGWDDIGYNFLVDRYGRILQGRHGGVRRPVIGAHAGGFNTGAIGVGVIGDHRGEPHTPETRQALTELLAWLCDEHGIDPQGRTRRVSRGSSRFPPGHEVELPTLCGHRDVSRTSCPGEPPYRNLPRLRRDVDNHRRTRGLSELVPLLGR